MYVLSCVCIHHVRGHNLSTYIDLSVSAWSGHSWKRNKFAPTDDRFTFEEENSSRPANNNNNGEDVSEIDPPVSCFRGPCQSMHSCKYIKL